MTPIYAALAALKFQEPTWSSLFLQSARVYFTVLSHCETLRHVMAWVAEVVKTSDQALVVDAKYEQFTRFCQPLLYKLAIASLSASGSRADVASQLLKASDSIASASAPSFPESAEVVEKQDHSTAEQLLDDISRSLILKGADSQESAVKLIRSELAAAAAEGGQQASPVGVGAPLAPQLPELP